MKEIKHTVKRDENVPKEPNNHNGFSIDQEFMSLLSKQMTKINATTAKLHYMGCGTMMGRLHNEL